MSRVLGGLPGFGKTRKQTASLIRRFDLGEANVSGNDSQDVVEIVCDAASESAKRFKLAGRKPFFLGALALSDVAEKDGDSAVARIGAHLEPNFARSVAGFEFHRSLFRQDAPIILFEGRVVQLGEFL